MSAFGVDRPAGLDRACGPKRSTRPPRARGATARGRVVTLPSAPGF